MGQVQLTIKPNLDAKGNVPRSKFKYKEVVEIKQNTGSWAERMALCLDPILNKEYGTFSRNNDRKFSDTLDILLPVLGCIYFGNSGTKYCVPNFGGRLSCENTCGFTQQEVENLYGCVNTYGRVTNDCNIYESGFCDCSVSEKTWDGLLKACKCPEGENDYGQCCSELVCSAEYKEGFSCATQQCECDEGYSRIPTIPPEHPNYDFNDQCIKKCGIGSDQNNPINYESSVGKAGCGDVNGENGDLCCDPILNMCKLDTGAWDGQQTSISKSQCLTQQGLWRITNNNSCPRTGHCDFPLCNWQPTSSPPPVQFLQPYETDGPAWIFTCEKCDLPRTSPPPLACEQACHSFCATQSVYNQYNKSNCGTPGTTDICECYCKI